MEAATKAAEDTITDSQEVATETETKDLEALETQIKATTSSRILEVVAWVAVVEVEEDTEVIAVTEVTETKETTEGAIGVSTNSMAVVVTKMASTMEVASTTAATRMATKVSAPEAEVDSRANQVALLSRSHQIQKKQNLKI